MAWRGQRPGQLAARKQRRIAALARARHHRHTSALDRGRGSDRSPRRAHRTVDDRAKGRAGVAPLAAVLRRKVAPNRVRQTALDPTKFKQERPERIDITSRRGGLAGKNLWRHISRCSDERPVLVRDTGVGSRSAESGSSKGRLFRGRSFLGSRKGDIGRTPARRRGTRFGQRFRVNVASSPLMTSAPGMAGWLLSPSSLRSGSDTSLARPKSSSLASPLSARIALAGLTSRCSTPLACAALSPAHSPRPICRPFSTETGFWQAPPGCGREQTQIPDRDDRPAHRRDRH